MTRKTHKPLPWVALAVFTVPMIMIAAAPGHAQGDDTSPQTIYWDRPSPGTSPPDDPAADHYFSCGTWGSYSKSYLGADAEYLEILRSADWCTTGRHATSGGIIHGVRAGSDDFDGYIESVLSHIEGERRFRCNFAHGSVVSCWGSGSWPELGTEFCHDVWAYSVYDGKTAVPIFPGYMSYTPGCANGDASFPYGYATNSHPPKGRDQPDSGWSGYVTHS